VRFLDIYRSNRDVEARTRRSIKDVLLGIDPDELAIRLLRPVDIATDSRGRILISDSKNPGIHVYDLREHKFEIYGREGKGKLDWPMGIDVDRQDNIYVADHKQQRVAKFDAQGNFLYALSGFLNPVGVAVDKVRSRLFVVDSKQHQVRVYTLEGELQDTIGERGSEEGQFNFPTFCDVDQNGNLYVVDTANWRVQIFDADFNAVGSFGTLGNNPGQFTRPKGITVDRRGIIYVVDGAFQNIQMFSRDLELLLVLGGPGKGSGAFKMPIGIHIDGQDMIYVADFGNSRMQRLEFLTETYDQLETER